jgi:Zn-dependent protease with chaperone function
VTPHPWLAFLAAIAPLPVIWLKGRRLLLRIDEPTFSEEWFRQRVFRLRVAVAAAVVAVILADGWWVPLWIAVAVTATWIGGFPSQKQVYGEAWSLGQFLRWRARTTLAVGAWILYLCSPLIVALPGPAAVLPLLILSVVWLGLQDRIIDFAFDARPLDDEVLVSRFAPIIAKATCPEPRVMSIGPRRGHLANAFARPGTRRGSVLMTDTLLRNLEPDETAAIFAHEIAHLKELTPRKAMQRDGALLAWTVFGILLELAAVRESRDLGYAVALLWPLLLLLTLIIRRRRHRHHEAESDLRAAELCGDPEALIRGLSKTHLLSRLPRRWDTAMEGRLTHPSLARRIQALRVKAGISVPAEPFTPVILRARKHAGDYFILDAGEARWCHSVPPETAESTESLLAAAATCERLPYGELTAIHVRPTMTGPVLVVRRGEEAPRLFPLHKYEAAAAQAALDRIDLHLGPARPAYAMPQEKAVPRVAAAVAFIMGLFPGISFPAAVAALAAFVFPSPATMAATGATAVLAAIAGILTRSPADHEPHILIAVALGAAGGLAFTFAFRGSRDHRAHRSAWVVTLALLGCAVVAAFPLFLAPPAVILFSRAARTRPGLAISLAGIAAATAFVPHRRWRVASGIALLAALFVVAGAMPWFVPRFAHDPLMSAHRAPVGSPPRLLSTVEFDRPLDMIRLSPDGKHFVARIRPNDDDERESLPFVLGGDRGVPAQLGEALAADFVDDQRLAVLERRDRKSVVRVVTLDGREESATPAPNFEYPDLLTEGGRWSVRDFDAEDGMLQARAPLRTTLLRVARQRIPTDDRAVLVLASDGVRTHVAFVDAVTHSITRIASLPGVVTQTAVTPDRLMVTRMANGDVVFFDPRRDLASRLSSNDLTNVTEVAIARETFAVLRWTPKGSEVRFYASR